MKNNVSDKLDSKENKKNNKIFKYALFLLMAILVLIISYFLFIPNTYSFNTSIELTQLKANTPKQMMGYFIKTKNGKTIVIDGGNEGDFENLEKYILENGGNVDYWFLTHYHSDHTGALSNIIRNTDIKINNIVYSFCDREKVLNYENSRISQYDNIVDALSSDRISKNLVIPKKGQIFNIDGVKIKIISVYENDITTNLGNNASMVFKMYVNSKSLLFLGDTGVESSEKLLKEDSNYLKSDYVQMAHHGQNGATFELYKKISPKYCLWPTPAWLWDNDLGDGFNTGPYKTVETRKWMDELNVKENYIEKDGDITLEIN